MTATRNGPDPLGEPAVVAVVTGLVCVLAVVAFATSNRSGWAAVCLAGVVLADLFIGLRLLRWSRQIPDADHRKDTDPCPAPDADPAAAAAAPK